MALTVPKGYPVLFAIFRALIPACRFSESTFWTVSSESGGLPSILPLARATLSPAIVRSDILARSCFASVAEHRNHHVSERTSRVQPLLLVGNVTYPFRLKPLKIVQRRTCALSGESVQSPKDQNVVLSLMSRLKHRGKARTIFLALSSAHHVLKGVDQFPASSINEGQNFRALIVQLLAFCTNSQIVGDTRI
jgi:hypothetical protein